MNDGNVLMRQPWNTMKYTAREILVCVLATVELHSIIHTCAVNNTKILYTLATIEILIFLGNN